MTKHRRPKRTKTRRSQKGGFWGFGESQDPNAPSFWGKLTNWGTSAVDKSKELGNSINTGLGDMGTQASNVMSSTMSNVGEGLSSLNPLSSNQVADANIPPAPVTDTNIPPDTTSVPTTQSVSTQGSFGGRRRRYRRTMKGGKGGLGLTYYATPVSGLRVAEPTTWQYYANGTNQYSVKGGSRKRRGRKSRKFRRHKRR